MDSDQVNQVPIQPVCSAAPPPKKKRITSTVWEHFTISADPTKVVCKLCKTKVSRGRDAKHLSTSAMHNHINFKHPTLAATHTQATPSTTTTTQPCPAPLTASSMPRIIAAFNAKTAYPPNHPTAKQITDTVGEMICLDLMPYSVVENRGFRKLLSVVAPRYSVPSRWHFSHKVVPQLYQEVKAKVKKSLFNMEGDVVHCTTDIWTSKLSTNAYLSLTGHWIERENKESTPGAVSHRRVAALLNMEVLNTDHTAANILHHLQSLVRDWQNEVGGRFSVEFFVTDNASNMVRAMADGGYVHIRCMAHTLHLVVTGALKDCQGVTNVITIARKLTGFVHRSNKATVKLHQTQEELGLPIHNLVHDVSTRWNSTFHMLQRLLEQKQALITMSTEMDLGGSLTHHQWELMEASVKILQPFEEATCTVCEEVTSLSSVIPCVQALRAAMTNLREDDRVRTLPEARKLVTSLRSMLDERFQTVFDDPCGHYYKATLLDPRFKSLPKSLLSSSDFDRLKADVISEVSRKLSHRSEVPAAATGDSSSGEQATHSESKSLFWGAMHKLAKPNAESPTTHLTTTTSIVENYLAESSTESLTTDPVMTYWATQLMTHPALAHVALKYLTCPPTSVSSERLFSTAGDVVSPHRSRLLPAHVQELVFTKYNLGKFE